jgi:probable F420-dependent oxidoreductase
MLELSASHADGAHPYLATAEHTATARQAIGDDKLLVVEQAATVVEDFDTWRERAHAHLEIYTGLPNYRNNWKRLGFDEDDFVRGGSDRLKEGLVPFGLEASVAAVEAHLDAGADHVVVQVLGEHALHLDIDAVVEVLAAAG